MKCQCGSELEVCGELEVGLHTGPIFRCPSCGREWFSIDSDGRLDEYVPLHKIRRVSLSMPPDFDPGPPFASP